MTGTVVKQIAQNVRANVAKEALKEETNISILEKVH